MDNPKRNQRIKITHTGRGYEVGKIYTVIRVDPNDNTLMATDSSGKEGGWVKWDYCEPAGPDIGFEWLKAHLPGETLELLSAFDGLESLSLKPEVRDYILNQLPDLKQRVLVAQIALDEALGSIQPQSRGPVVIPDNVDPDL